MFNTYPSYSFNFFIVCKRIAFALSTILLWMLVIPFGLLNNKNCVCKYNIHISSVNYNIWEWNEIVPMLVFLHNVECPPHEWHFNTNIHIMYNNNMYKFAYLCVAYILLIRTLVDICLARNKTATFFIFISFYVSTKILTTLLVQLSGRKHSVAVSVTLLL